MASILLLFKTNAVSRAQHASPSGISVKALLAARKLTRDVHADPKPSGRHCSWLEEQSRVLSSGSAANDLGRDGSWFAEMFKLCSPVKFHMSSGMDFTSLLLFQAGTRISAAALIFLYSCLHALRTWCPTSGGFAKSQALPECPLYCCEIYLMPWALVPTEHNVYYISWPIQVPQNTSIGQAKGAAASPQNNHTCHHDVSPASSGRGFPLYRRGGTYAGTIQKLITWRLIGHSKRSCCQQNFQKGSEFCNLALYSFSFGLHLRQL